MRKAITSSIIISIAIVAIIGTSALAAPSTPPPGGYTGGIFSYYFKNIIEGSGSITGTTSGGVCPIGQVIRGFSTSAGTYGLPICVNPTADNGSASSFTGGLVGTSNYIPKYTSTGTGIVNSQIFDDGTNIGIGTAVPGEKLDISGGSIRTTNQFISTISPGTAPLIVSSDTLNTNLNADLLDGNDSTYFAPASTTVTIGTNQTITGSKIFDSDILVNGLTIGLGGGQLSTNTALGASALASNTTSEFNTAIGNNALALSTAGWWNTAIGHSALSSNTTGSFNTAIGGDALGQNISGINNIAVGNSSLYSNITGQDNAGFGRESLRNNVSGTANTAIGPYALYSNTTGIGNTALGNGAFSSVISSWDSVGIGISAGQNLESGGNNIAIGAYTNFASTGASDQLNIGNWIYGNAGNIGIGTGTNLSAKLTVDGDIRITGGSPGSGLVLTSDATGLASWQSPVVSGITGGQSNRVARWITSTSLGTGAIYDDGVNVGIGTATPGGKFEVWDGSMSIFHGRNLNLGVGAYATNYLASGINNFGIGNFSLASITTASNNVALGGVSLAANSIGNYNIGIGERALQNSTGNSNTAIGANAGNTLTSGDNNIFLGYNVQPNISTTSSNQLNIGNWIYGNAGNIGIGTATPGVGAKLDIAGRIKITDGSQGSGKVLYGDGNGLASWGNLPADLPVGTVMAFNSVSCPAGWAIADGTSGTPDLRGEFIRGLDSGRGVDTGRVLGTNQGGQTNAASFNIRTGYSSSVYPPISNITGDISITTGDGAYGASLGIVGYSHNGHRITIGSGTETRPRNVALLYCIKISTYSAPAPQTWYNTTSSPSGNLALATTGNVGVGTTTPTEKLEVVGKVKIVDGNQGTGLVLTSDGNGVATWQIAPGDLPIGTVMAFNSLSCPVGWAVADGTNGTLDLRGEFVRGLDNGRGVDTGRVLGSQQRGSLIMSNATAGTDFRVFTLQSDGSIRNNLGFDSITGSVNPSATYRWNQVTGSQGVWGVGSPDGNYVGATRPRNVALLYCMKISVAPGSLSNSGTWVNVSGTSTGHVALGTSGNVGVGTTTPTEKLEVQGSIKVVDGNQGTGKVLISDANGKATWQEMPGDLPVGSIMPFNGASCPAGWAIANGVGGTPDLRGEFIRGLDSGRGVDTGRALGSTQAQDWKGFYMQNTVQNGTAYAHNAVYMGKSTSAYVGNIFAGYWSSPSAAIGAMWDSSEIRPRNVALLYCMKVSAAPATASNSVTWMNVDGTSSGRVALATTGNVGIGTAAPTTKLEVIGDGGNTIDSRFTGRMEIDSTQSPGIWYNRNGDAAVFAGREESLVPNQAWGIWTSSGGWNTFNVYKNGNIKTGPFYFDGNDDTWMRLRDSDGGTYKDLAVGQLYASTNVYGGAFYYNSDESLKTNIEKIYSPIEKILKLNGYTFNWKGSGKADIGVIAQEVEQVFPELVSTNPETGLKSVQYGNLVAPIIEALHELVAQVKSLYSITEEQNTRINNLERENAELKARLDAIEIRLAQ